MHNLLIYPFRFSLKEILGAGVEQRYQTFVVVVVIGNDRHRQLPIFVSLLFGTCMRLLTIVAVITLLVIT